MATESVHLNPSTDDVRPPGRTSSFWRRLRPLLIWCAIGAATYGYVKWMEPPAPVATAGLARTPGARLVYKYECGRCHTIARLPGVVGHDGPALDGVAARAATRAPGLDADGYLRQSLREPGKVVVRGYLNVMPSFQNLSEAELHELVAYLRTL